ncbi:glycosyltransferase family 2 protein [Flavilitoribacter nigricans]|uniref:Glycosyl transferase n=1 Tax=Flavilitoribacter nigricans (strain ATCC 23147 / DSM 23189 / NBRC 102662 / NCIMB 1420 / SS-2) TaxID=1122177 RepID=A0A2D0NCM1_FLAN2|nr:glycosyltransferase family 2 protein [Flavilitoribacter nigricans]PHN06227.1 glycosyl transferase [Flavilitoribacter nigricans DSM 23189 = NBRC 102662]
MKVIFWVSLFLLFYTYLGYGMLLFFLVKFKGKRKIPAPAPDSEVPKVTFLVAAYNESHWIKEKFRNSLELDYPAEKLELLFVTDGSDDDTPDQLRALSQDTSIRVLVEHQPERRGKIAAVHRVMPKVNSPIVIYSDANTLLNTQAIRNIVRHYQVPEVGAVAGEKRILQEEKEEASSSGEGFYWKYESQLKKWDAQLYSVVGAAGELFSIRTDLYENIPNDTIIEDFYLTLRIAQKGYRVQYEDQAYAMETASASVKEELKRKIRIAAGGLQAIYRLAPLLNIFRYGWLSFQYISHRVLRWTLAPLALITLFISNLALLSTGSLFYQITLAGQVLFYLAALLGWLLEKRKLRSKALFIPYYFCIMNYAVYRGLFRILGGRQSVLWERAQRKV